MLRALVLVAALLATGSTIQAEAGQPLAITTVANPRPQLISGTRTLLRISPAAPGLRVTQDGRDVTTVFQSQPDGSVLGLVTGLTPGSHQITATARNGHGTTRLTVRPSTGPVFSGPQQQPFFCETTAFGLAPATQPDCSAPAVVSYQYRNTAGRFAPLADPASRPADLATATVDGRSVPYVVRVETGTIDRAVYQIAALTDGATPSALRPEPTWNGRLVYSFGGGCNGGYHQGNSTGGVLNDLMLSQGYAVASSTLNVLDQNCSTMLSAEAAMMVKEHFVNTYGPVRYTIGWGGSGGAIQQYAIADTYPGILDGIVPGVSFPDPLSVMRVTSDCALLEDFFAGPGGAFSPDQRQAIAGFPAYSSCVSWDQSFANRITPTGSCNKQIFSVSNAIPAEAMWNRDTNPDGVKCSMNQQLANQFGIDPRTGFARSALDNVGVQYGLQALNDGHITIDQFLTLNQRIGGFDVEGNPVGRRTTADQRALTAAYRDSVLVSGSLGLRTTPIIDQRTNLDHGGFLSDIHTTEWSFVMRTRLQQANGTAANQVIIQNQRTPDQTAEASRYQLAAMDRWLAAIAADHSQRSAQQKVIANKPGDLGDGCYLAATERIVSPLTYPASGPCATQYPVGTNPRLVAGAPLPLDILKCRLRPVDFAEYRVPLSALDKDRLRSTFPEGVCDYRAPGVGQVAPLGSWLSYGDSSVGTFGHAPPPIRLR
ncbi:DUF6351 family protein [Kibdelosporangium aridum]|uniref:DUF6351 family protein n=1 Tax=Kibdelosporangium aridum TaxID=2030 RepID=UPI0007C50C57